MAREQLRIAVALPDPGLPEQWVIRLVNAIHACAELQFCGLLGPVVPPERRSTKPLMRLWHRLEAKFAARVTPADGATFAEACDGIPVLLPTDEVGIADIGADVVLDLSGEQGRVCNPSLARHGVWFVDCDMSDAEGARLHGIIGSDPVSRISLFRRSHRDHPPRAIASGAVNTKFIAARNALFLKEKAPPLILRELKRTWLQGRAGDVEGEVFMPAPSPTAGDFLAYLASLIAETTRRIIFKLQDRLGFRPGMFFLKTAGDDFLAFEPAQAVSQIQKGNAYQADPFLWRHEGETYCFFETFDYASGVGHISVGQLRGDRMQDIRTALRADYHLSFPFLFEHAGELFMMPESCGARRIEIWRCTGFPDKWELHAKALEGVLAADSSLAHVDGQWWLFTNISADPFGDTNSELHLFQIDGPDLASIKPHPLNPVVFDSRTARNAGRILERDGVLYRPSQDNSHGLYGYGLNIMRLNRLSMEEYSESLVRRIQPDFEPGIIGCHHLDMRDGRLVMDVRKRLGGRG